MAFKLTDTVGYMTFDVFLDQICTKYRIWSSQIGRDCSYGVSQKMYVRASTIQGCQIIFTVSVQTKHVFMPNDLILSQTFYTNF